MTEYTDIDVDEIVKITERAVLVRIDREEYWLPKTGLDLNETPVDEDHMDMPHVLSVAVWLAEERGLV